MGLALIIAGTGCASPPSRRKINSQGSAMMIYKRPTLRLWLMTLNLNSMPSCWPRSACVQLGRRQWSTLGRRVAQKSRLLNIRGKEILEKPVGERSVASSRWACRELCSWAFPSESCSKTRLSRSHGNTNMTLLPARISEQYLPLLLGIWGISVQF